MGCRVCSNLAQNNKDMEHDSPMVASQIFLQEISIKKIQVNIIEYTFSSLAIQFYCLLNTDNSLAWKQLQ